MFGPKKRILILEDEVALAKALSIKFESEGYNVTLAKDGEIALSFVEQERFDLAILDLMTPKVNGFMVLERMKEKQPETAAFVVSNLSQKEDMERALQLGALKYFVKSNISLSDIVEEAKKVLKS